MGIRKPQGRPVASLIAVNLALIALHLSEYGVRADELSNEDCLVLGFADSLECSTCEKLQEIVLDGDLYRECRGCCRVVSNEETLYDEAKLQICD